MKSVPMVNGRGWEWSSEHYDYQAVHLNGTSTVRLYFRAFGAFTGLPSTSWEFGHSREIPENTGARGVAQLMYDFTTHKIDHATYNA